jgi:hypothetical protein
MAAMTSNSIVIVETPTDGSPFNLSLYNADVSGTEDLIAASTGHIHYINKIVLYAQSVTDVTFTIGSDENSGAVKTIYLGPIPLPDAGGKFEIDFGDNSMKCAVSTALTIDSSATCPVFVYLEGKTV